MATTQTELPDQREIVDEEMLDHDDGLYKHIKRPQWGVAILAWEKDDRRAYQFEDGRLRKFKEGYYSLMQPTDDVERDPSAVAKDLRDALEANRGKPRPEALDPVAAFQDQIDLFLELYPAGFQDENWIADHRGGGPGRSLKRHREPSIEAVRQDLSKERCDELIEADRHGDLVDSVTEILGNSTLVALKHVKVLRRLEGEERQGFAESVRDLLHGDDDFADRFRAHMDVLSDIFGGRPSWRIATVLPALMYPEDHVCVRRSAFIRQAATIAPMARYSRRAKLGSYKNFRRVAFAVRQKLQAAGHEPRDMLDIHDFVWATLRNAALDHLGD